MTKDGRLSPIIGIRYFMPSSWAYLEGLPAVTAFGRRVAWWLNGERVSIGPQTELYVHFTTDLPEGQVEISDKRADWWQLYAYVGVSDTFPYAEGAESLALKATTDILSKLVQADQTYLVDEAANVALRYGDNLRFLLRCRETRAYNVEVSCTISDTHEHSSLLFAALTDRATGQYYAAPPAEIGSYLFAHKLSNLVKIRGLSGRIPPNRPAPDNFASLRQGLDLLWSLADFAPCERPLTSKRVA